MQLRCEFPYSIAEFINSIESTSIQFSNWSSFRKTNCMFTSLGAKTAINPSTQNPIQQIERPHQNSPEQDREMRTGVESRAWILGLTRSDPDAMPPDRSTNRSRPALLRIKGLLLELNCAGVRRIGLWGMQRGRSKHGRLRRESVLGRERRERALNAFQLHRGREEGTDEPAFNAQSRLVSPFWRLASWRLSSARADENTSWRCECDCVNSDVQNCYRYQTRWLRYHHPWSHFMPMQNCSSMVWG
jgi:hypothetical protein